MLRRCIPAALLDQQTSVLRTQLDGVYDGCVDAVHDARVATRRIREVLAVLRVSPDGADDADVAASYKEVGRALGKVRDIDVQIALIKDLETHAPHTASSLVLVRQEHERDRQFKMRRLIKTLEGVDVEALLRTACAHHPAGLRTRLTSRAWRDRLRQLLVERADTAVDRVAHATGVYFPKRAHRARVAIKKLRYAAEIAQVTGLADMRRAIKSLRKAQEILGDLHDRQSLSETLAGHATHDHVNADHITLISHVLEGDILERHSQYLSRREDLRDAFAEIERASGRAFPARPAIAVGGAIVLSGLAYARRRWPARRDLPDRPRVADFISNDRRSQTPSESPAAGARAGERRQMAVH